MAVIGQCASGRAQPGDEDGSTKLDPLSTLPACQWMRAVVRIENAGEEEVMVVETIS